MQKVSLEKWVDELQARIDQIGRIDGSQQAKINSITAQNEYLNDKPYLNRTTTEDATLSALTKLVGCSVVVNQLVPASGISYDNSGITITESSGELTIDGTSEGRIYCSLSCSSVSDHVYYLYLSKALTGAYVYNDNHGVSSDSRIIGKADANSTFYLTISSGNTYSQEKLKVGIIDLTQMLGADIAEAACTKETATAGSGIAWLKEYGFDFTEYQAYNAGTIATVNPNGKKVVGKNLLPVTLASTSNNGITYSIDSNGIITASGTLTGEFSSVRIYQEESNNMPTGDYVLNGCPGGYGQNLYLNIWDSATDVKDYGSGVSKNLVNGRRFYVAIVVRQSLLTPIKFKPMLRYTSVTDAAFEPYTTETYPIEASPLYGIPALSNDEIVYDGDIRSSDGSTTRYYEYRAYEEGDESLTDAITDGTNTVVKLDTPTTETLTPFVESQAVYKDGTETFTYESGYEVPVGNVTYYYKMPDWLGEDGAAYLIDQVTTAIPQQIQALYALIATINTEIDSLDDRVYALEHPTTTTTRKKTTKKED